VPRSKGSSTWGLGLTRLYFLGQSDSEMFLSECAPGTGLEVTLESEGSKPVAKCDVRDQVDGEIRLGRCALSVLVLVDAVYEVGC